MKKGSRDAYDRGGARIRATRSLPDGPKRRLTSVLSHSTDAVEGYWSYFDRRTDDDRARIGGKYRLAIVGNGSPGGYDIPHADGAVTGAGPMAQKAM